MRIKIDYSIIEYYILGHISKVQYYSLSKMNKTPAKIINLADRRAKKEDEAQNAPIRGWIIWLHCPKCKSLEYSEIEIPEGRIHKCGTLVEEEEVQIDVRAEYTISLRNSLRLEELFKQTKIPGFLKPLAKKGIGMLENLGLFPLPLLVLRHYPK